MQLPERIPLLEVGIGDNRCAGQLIKASGFEFRYLDPRPDQPSMALLMAAKDSPTWRSGDLFAPMDQNLPEGDLMVRIRELFPKQPLTAMHLLALIGANGIGRLGYAIPSVPPTPAPPPLSRESLLRTAYSPAVFDELVRAYLGTGSGIAGIQPKIMIPERAAVPIPSLIVKATSASYPGLAANEFLCLTAARNAGIRTPTFALSDDGQLLILDRFDMLEEASGRIERLGFEDIAALSGLRVRDALSDRKYQGSYQRIAELLQQLQLPRDNLARFFEQVAFSAMVRNGDAHLKNFGLLYRSASEIWLAPMFDVVTTAIYPYTRYEGGPALEDNTMALKLFAGRHQTKTYPTTAELLTFGRKVCGVTKPEEVIDRIAQGMLKALGDARGDERIPKPLLASMSAAWEKALAYAA